MLSSLLEDPLELELDDLEELELPDELLPEDEDLDRLLDDELLLSELEEAALFFFSALSTFSTSLPLSGIVLLSFYPNLLFDCLI